MKYSVQPLIAFQRVVTRVMQHRWTKFILAVPSYLHSPPFPFKLFLQYLLPFSLLYHAFLIITSCLPHHYIMPSSLLHHAFLIITSCFSHYYIMPSSLLHHAFLIITSCLPHYYIMPSSLLHHAFLIITSCLHYYIIPSSLPGAVFYTTNGEIGPSPYCFIMPLPLHCPLDKGEGMEGEGCVERSGRVGMEEVRRWGGMSEEVDGEME